MKRCGGNRNPRPNGTGYPNGVFPRAGLAEIRAGLIGSQPPRVRGGVFHAATSATL